MHKIERDLESMYYLYRHLCEDTLIPFYIGIGIKRKFHSATIQSEYERAYNFNSRSGYWKNVYNKHGCVVEILYESNNREEIGMKLDLLKLKNFM